jgi:hypothetical protein
VNSNLSPLILFIFIAVLVFVVCVSEVLEDPFLDELELPE